MKTLRILLSCICIFLSSTILAYDFEQDGFYYEFIPNEFHCVAMCGIENDVLPESYHGNLTMPVTVTYCGIKYDVTGINNIENVSNITTLTIHSKINTLPIFSFPSSLKEFIVDEANDSYCSVDGVLYSKDKTSIVTCPMSYDRNTVFNIPAHVTKVETSCFSGCDKITTINIPASVRQLGSSYSWVNTGDYFSAFDGLHNLLAINVDSDNEFYSSHDGVLYDKQVSKLLCYPCKKFGAYSMPASVTSLSSEFMFAGASNLTSLVINKNLDYNKKTITRLFLTGCERLTNLEVPESLTWLDLTRCANLKNLNSLPNSIEILQLGGCSSLESLTIPSSVENIDLSACLNLRNVVIPEGVKSFTLTDNTNITHIDLPSTLTDLNLSGCTSIVSLELPKNLRSLNLSGWTELSSIVLPQTVTDVSFVNCEKLSSMNFPAGLKSMNLWNCKSLTQIEVPDGVTYLMVQGCTGLKSLTLPSLEEFYCSDTNIEEITYRDGVRIIPICRLQSLKTVKWTNSVTTISDEAFKGCTSLLSVGDMSSVRTIGNSAFEGCSSLENIGNMLSVNTIGEFAFYECSSLRKVEMSGTIKELPNRVFSGCKNLEDVKLPTSIKTIAEEAFSRCPKLKNFTFPENLESIGEYAFDRCGLKEIVLPESVTYMGDYTFFDCDSLESITFPSSLSKIPYHCLGQCDNLKNVCIPDGVNYIGEAVIWYCKNLESIDIPSSVLELEVAAISWNDNLKTIRCYALEPPKIHTLTTFIGNHGNMTIYVHPLCVNIYKNNSQWGNFTIKAIGEEPTNPTTPEDEPTQPSEDEKDTDISEFDNLVYFAPANIRAGKQCVLPLQMKNKMDVASMTFDVYMPEGVEIDKNARGNYNITFNAEANRADATTHTLTSKLQADDAVRVLCYSATAETFLGNEGAVFDFPVTVASAMEAGDYKVVIRNIELTDAQGKSVYIDKVVSTLTVPSYTLGDANDDGKIGTADLMYIVNKILGTPAEDFNAMAADVNEDGKIGTADLMMVVQYILNGEFPAASAAAKSIGLDNKPQSNVTLKVKPFAINTGETKTITLELDNEGVDASAFVCDIKLPEGLTADVDAMAFNATANRTNAAFHAMPVAIQADGAVRILCYSANGESLLGMSGAVIDIPVTASADIKQGEAVLTIANQEVVNADGTKAYCPEAYNAKVMIGGVTGVATVSGAEATESIVSVYNAVGIRQSKVQSGLNIIVKKDGEVIKATK